MGWTYRTQTPHPSLTATTCNRASLLLMHPSKLTTTHFHSSIDLLESGADDRVADQVERHGGEGAEQGDPEQDEHRPDVQAHLVVHQLLEVASALVIVHCAEQKRSCEPCMRAIPVPVPGTGPSPTESDNVRRCRDAILDACAIIPCMLFGL